MKMNKFSLNLLIVFCAIIIPKKIKALLTSNVGVIPTMKFEAMYQFGDSLSDTGNLVLEPNGRDVNFARLPYGTTYFHRATGRCSDGLLMVDFFAMFFQLPLLNPYLARGSDFTHGVNFAVAGATALDYPITLTTTNFSTATYSSLSTQVNWFKSHLASICRNLIDCRRRMQKSLVIMGEIGGNDYNFAFFHGQTVQEVYALVPQVIHSIKNAILEVVKLGAKNIVVPGNFPIGCVPIYLVQFRTNDASKYDELHCLKEYNDFSKYHNQLLNEAIQQVQVQYPSVAIAYADSYSALTWLLRHAPSLGHRISAILPFLNPS
ncbi:hypothetical protein RND81_05G016600 [Saponaria officinalis]|uniref:Acetylajmalan esterase-like n=1 Tax=Saponaria officinalis TaxID=3572 RepID=A0AAW1KSF3_SAPOF